MAVNWTFGRKLALGVAVIVVAFAAVAITGLRTTQSLVSNAELVAHTHEVRGQLSRMLAGLIEAETSERGFVITGNERFLEPYRAALSSLDASFDAVHELTSDNKRQQDR